MTIALAGLATGAAEAQDAGTPTARAEAAAGTGQAYNASISVQAGGGGGGGWNSLLEFKRYAAELRREQATQPPTACPLCGEPLQPAGGPRLHCRFDGWLYQGGGAHWG